MLRSLATILLAFAFILPAAAAPTQQKQTAKVMSVADGDTITVQLAGRNEKVRLIGVNTPETVDPRRPVECFGREASAFTKKLLTGKTVTIEDDRSQDTRDKYGRLLRYVWVGKTFVNLELVRQGYAYEYTYAVPYKYQKEFKAAQRDAQKAGRGLWGSTTCNGKTTAATGQPVTKPAPVAPARGNCDPSYPSLCIPPGAADLDCPDIPQRRFAVVGADPHRFDGDRDGVGCES